MNAPLTPSDLDLRDFTYMPLDVVRLRDSDMMALSTAEGFRAAVSLWCASWHQVPAASLPNDDRVLCHLAGFGRDMATWLSVREEALRGFLLCSDDRFYHPVIAEKANEAKAAKDKQRSRTNKANELHWGVEADPQDKRTPAEKRSDRLAQARKLGKHTPAQWQALLQVCDFRCVKCGADDNLCKDHITPIYKGGSDAIDNIQPLCTSCNSKKGADTTDLRPNGWSQGVSAVLNASSRGVERLQGKGREQKGEEREQDSDDDGKIIHLNSSSPPPAPAAARKAAYPFPATGGIGYGRFGDACREVAPGTDPDVIAAAFRPWAIAEGIPFDREDIERVFRKFAKGHRVGRRA
jgi:5-methylcytosine-specific restriction endonuclease McrA